MYGQTRGRRSRRGKIRPSWISGRTFLSRPRRWPRQCRTAQDSPFTHRQPHSTEHKKCFSKTGATATRTRSGRHICALVGRDHPAPTSTGRDWRHRRHTVAASWQPTNATMIDEGAATIAMKTYLYSAGSMAAMPWPDEQGRWVAGRTCALRFYLPIPIPIPALRRHTTVRLCLDRILTRASDLTVSALFVSDL